jgi:response regulator of citrate/malate metabolism
MDVKIMNKLYIAKSKLVVSVKCYMSLQEMPISYTKGTCMLDIHIGDGKGINFYYFSTQNWHVYP